MEATVTDYCGNQYPASRLGEPESPSFDTLGAKKDAAYRALGSMCSEISDRVAKAGDTIRILKAGSCRKLKGRVGQEGKVVWRGADAFGRRSRYGSAFSGAVMASMGKSDRIGVRFADGQTIFMSAFSAVDEGQRTYAVVHRPTDAELQAEAQARHAAKRSRIEADIARIHSEIAAKGAQ